MASLKEQLDAAGYDTSGLDESKILSQLDAAGYDTSSLAPAAPKAEPESKTRQIIRKVADALPTVGAIGVPAAAGLATEGLSLPATAGLAGVGGASGEAVKQLILRGLNAKSAGDFFTDPTAGPSAGSAAADIGIEGAKDAALTYAGGKILPKVAEGAGKAFGFGKKLLFSPNAAEVAAAGEKSLIEAGQAGKEAIANVAERGAEKLGLAREVAAAGKEGLIKAEEGAGLHFQSTPEFESFISDPKKLAKFSDRFSRLIKQGPEQLSQTVDSQTLQTLRKVAQEGEKMTGLSDIAKAQLRQIKDITTQALGKSEPEVGTQLSRLREANQVVSDIPGEIKAKISSQKLLNAKNLAEKKIANAENLSAAEKLDRTRKLIKAGLAGAGAYLGFKKISGGHH